MLSTLKTRTVGLQVAVATALVFILPTADAMAGFRFP